MKFFKYWILIATALALNSVGSAQTSFNNSPNDTIVDWLPLEVTGRYPIIQTARSADTLHLRYKKLDVQLPGGWSAHACDPYNCYTVLVDSGCMPTVLPGSQGILTVYVSPSHTYGTGIIRYTIWDSAAPTQVDTLTWIVHTKTTGITSTTEKKPRVYVAAGQLFVSRPESKKQELLLQDITGKIVLRSELITAQTSFHLGQLPLGIYVMQIIGANQHYVQRVFVGE
jgi:hypothetical protein